MIVFEINHTDNKILLQNMAAVMGMPYKGEDFINITPPIGTGVIKILKIAEELQVLMADATFYHHLLAKREYSKERYYILHFDDLYINDMVTFSVDGETLKKSNTRHFVARLTSNVFSNTEEVTANTPFKTIKIFFSEAWLKKYLGLGADADGLQKYIALKTESFDIEQLDPGYLKLMDELWTAKKDDPLQNIFLQNRVSLLIERFFTRLQTKSNLLQGKFDLSPEIIAGLIKVEHILINDFSKQPPTIEEFSKLVSMSSTKLKKSFKTMYGDSIYSYYQKQRLQKANELMLSGKYTVRHAANAVGYNYVPNFNLAFKKQFKILPGKLISDK
jgi:AraC-like DNA-binding protein